MRSVRVARKWQEAEGIWGFELADPGGGHLPGFSAGAHVDVRVPGGLVRQYSLCRQVSESGSYEIAVLREPASRGGSRALCEAVLEGDLLEISEPRNHFPLHPVSGGHSLLFAGGIGITPILCMAERLAAIDASFELHYCSRTRARMAFHDRLAGAAFASRVAFHFDDGPDYQKLDLPRALSGAAPHRHLYICGPAGFLEAVRRGAAAARWPDSQIHFEYFSPPPDPVAHEAGSFEVVLASTGRSISVGENESVVDALARIGIDIPVSCQQGVCGTCLTRIIEGEPDHRDYFLNTEERAANDQFLPCCSRAKTKRLVLDL